MTYFGQKLKGFFFLFFTVFSWSISITLLKLIFLEINFDGPFFVAYLSNSLNVIYFFANLRKYVCPDKESKPDTTNMSYIKLGIFFAFPLFAANYFYTKGIRYTNMASAEVLADTSFVFIFLLSMPILQTKFSFVKLLCVIAAFGGVSLVQLADSEDVITNTENPVLGDILATISALFYALYSIYLKKYIVDEAVFNWCGFFGVVGATVFIGIFPLFFILHFTGIESFAFPTVGGFFFIVLEALIGNVVANYTWGRSLVLLGPLISDLGLSLTIPLIMIIDYFVEGKRYTLFYLIGAVYIMTAFTIATIYDYKEGIIEARKEKSDIKAKRFSLIE